MAWAHFIVAIRMPSGVTSPAFHIFILALAYSDRSHFHQLSLLIYMMLLNTVS